MNKRTHIIQVMIKAIATAAPAADPFEFDEDSEGKLWEDVVF